MSLEIQIIDVLGRVGPYLAVWLFFSFLATRRKKKKSQGKPEDKYRKQYIVKSDPAIMTIMVFSFLVFSGCLIGAYIENQLGGLVGIGFGSFAAVKNYKFSEITEVVHKGRGTLMIYIEDKKIFTIDDNIDTERFMQQVKDMRIHYKWK